jgi:AcrR family transcriptional regulator
MAREASTRGDAARSALIATAERLFAERGLEGVSLRDVSAAAGQRNHSAAQYHFGGRDGLIAAVVDARMSIINERRHVRFAAISDAGRDGDLRSLVEVLVAPTVEVVHESDGWYARFLSRVRWEPVAWQALMALPVSSSFTEVLRRIDRAIGHLPRPLRRHRLDAVSTLFVGTLAGWEGAPDRGERRLPVDQLIAELVSSSVAVLTVDTPAPTIDRPLTRSIT